MKLACPNCGSNVYYKVNTNSVFCSHCNCETKISLLNKQLLDVDLTNLSSNFETNKYACSSCGAKFFTLEKQLVESCNFCGSTNLLMSDYEITKQKTKIIPFVYDKTAFLNEFRNFISENKISNVEFFREEKIEKITGLYVPVSKNNYQLEFNSIGNATDKKHGSSLTNYKYNSSYEAQISYDRLRSLPDYVLNNLMPFTYENAMEFSPYYLAGFACTQPDDYEDTKLKASSPFILNGLKEAMKSNFSINYNASDLANQLFFNATSNEEFLVPIWLCSYNYNGEIYSFAMNGQTGKIISTLPLDTKKLKDIQISRAKNAAKVIRKSFYDYFIWIIKSSTDSEGAGIAIVLSLLFMMVIILLKVTGFLEDEFNNKVSVSQLSLLAIAVLTPLLIVLLVEALSIIIAGYTATKKFYETLNNSLSNINYDKNYNFIIRKTGKSSYSFGEIDMSNIEKNDSIYINNKKI